MSPPFELPDGSAFRQDFLQLEKRWLELARSIEFGERLHPLRLLPGQRRRVNWSRISSRNRMRRQGVEDVKGKMHQRHRVCNTNRIDRESRDTTPLSPSKN
jgi:predicted nucleic acid-binding OB-fold protein